MIDSIIAWENKLKKPKFFDQIKNMFPDYVVVTIHRQSNVADFEKFKRLIDLICEANKNSLVVFPTHPRVTPLLRKIRELPQNLYIVSSQPYLEFNYLVKNAALVITDSGGVSEETTYFGVPCLTLRSNTERPETVTIGTNHIVGENLGSLGKLVQTVKNKKPFVRAIPELWDGSTANRIVDVLIRFLQKNS
jgi:UDP-N-acetylglucosamine 2-epimerase (non-hydrolysing)